MEKTMAKLVPVESSMIQAVGYDPETRILEVVFNSGQTYCYEDVPPEVHQALMAADSKGQYMRAAIIGVYPDYRHGRSAPAPLCAARGLPGGPAGAGATGGDSS